MKPTTLFCPKCGNKMEQMGDEFGCVKGNMPLSKVALKTIQNLVTNNPSAHIEQKQKVRFGGHWFCPVDATPLVEDSGIVQCSVCHRALPSNLIYQLIEFHPHR